MSANETAIIADSMDAFFAPSSTDMVHSLIARYRQARERIATVAAFSNGDECKSVIGYFLDGNSTEDRGRHSMAMTADQMFKEEGAIAALNSAYWSEALALTDVYDAMPQARRDEWNKVIREKKAPEFEDEVVRATLQDLLNSRAKFMAERVDGIFRALSGTHVTNSPAAFRNRMIIAHLVTSYGTTAYERVGYINDLRCVIAKFMGRGEPAWNATSSIVDFARKERRGEWVTIDGGALRLRAYKCGTAHLEVHPDMAWRLNCVLAQLYPLAIPPEFREKPKKKPKDFVMMGRPLPFPVIEALSSLEPAYNFVSNDSTSAWREPYRKERINNAVQFRYGQWPEDKTVRDEVERVIAYLGGVKVDNGRNGHWYEFEYAPGEAIREVMASGCLPDQKAHQYYATPENLAQVAVEMAQIRPGDVCLEPSAGTGGLANLMPKDRTYCVEISALHCKVLKAKGFNVIHGDFLKWDAKGPFDRIVMNPPFASGRWQLHIEHAVSLLRKGGRLVAILPASAKNKDVLPGLKKTWSRVFENEFAGTSVDVVILLAEAV